MDRVNKVFNGGGTGAGLLFSDLRFIPCDADVAGDADILIGLVTADVEHGEGFGEPGLNGGGGA